MRGSPGPATCQDEAGRCEVGLRWLSWDFQDSRCNRSSETLATYLSLSEAFPHNPCCLPAPIDTWPWNVGGGRTRIGRGP